MGHLILPANKLRSGRVLSYKSIIYHTIMPTERYPRYVAARSIAIALDNAESILSSHYRQLLLTIATYIFIASWLMRSIHVSDKILYTNLSSHWYHTNDCCARDETPLYQCYWKNRRFPPLFSLTSLVKRIRRHTWVTNLKNRDQNAMRTNTSLHLPHQACKTLIDSNI